MANKEHIPRSFVYDLLYLPDPDDVTAGYDLGTFSSRELAVGWASRAQSLPGFGIMEHYWAREVEVGKPGKVNEVEWCRSAIQVLAFGAAEIRPWSEPQGIIPVYEAVGFIDEYDGDEDPENYWHLGHYMTEEQAVSRCSDVMLLERDLKFDVFMMPLDCPQWTSGI